MLKKIITENVVRADPNAPEDPTYAGFPGDILYNPATLELLAHDEATRSLKPLSSSSGAATAGAKGIEAISSGTITEPVKYFDVALPQDGYAKFIIEFMQIETSSNLSMAWSINDVLVSSKFDTYDTYRMAEISANVRGNVNHQNVYADFWYGGEADNLAYISTIFEADVKCTGTLLIQPGDLNNSPIVRVSTSCITQDIYFGQSFISVDLNPVATDAPVYGRLNFIRILPYGHGDCDPPTSSETIKTGSWVLYGVKV